MTYTIDLTTVLKSLFVVLTRMHRSPARISWSELEEAFQAYERSGSRQRIHRRISQISQQDQQVSDTDIFRRIFHELPEVEDAEVPAPVAVPVTPLKPVLLKPVLVATSNSGPVVTSNSAPVAVPEPASRPSRRRRVLWQFPPWRSAPQPSAPNLYNRQDVSVPASLPPSLSSAVLTCPCLCAQQDVSVSLVRFPLLC
jgi:hypothetical protein